MRILVVDDDLFNRVLVRDILAPLGECDTAEDGPRAIEAFRSALAAGKPYRLVTLDIIMPEMNGMEVLKSLRALEDDAGVAPATIVMITSESDADTILTSYDARCDSYLTKPIQKQALLDKLAFLGLDT